MNLPALRFGHIGAVYGPEDRALKLLEAIKDQEGGDKGIYHAVNWSPGAQIGYEPRIIYLTGEHLNPGEKRPYPELFTQFHVEEYRESHPMEGFIGEEAAASDCRSGNGQARIHRVFNLA